MKFLIKRFFELIPVIWGVGTIVFLLLHLIPGDPVDIMLGENALPAKRDSLRASLNLDKPLITQYGIFWKSVLSGNLGESYISRKPVADLLKERVFATFSLAFFSIIWALVISIPLGVLAAVFRRTLIDQAVLLISVFGVAMPNFWFGPLLVLFFSIQLGWLPVSEMNGFSSYILPSFTLGLGLSAILMRMTRATLVEVLTQDYIVTAKSKGISWWALYFKHALRNALIPLITLIGMQIGGLLAGAVITETIFDWPGIGELIYRGIQSRDFPVVQGAVLVIAFTYVAANTLADLSYSFANPRIRIE
ncbi:MAG: ABC transporter permease [Oligoflexia bacterium]|nr:ABC transporter permease [Oligoflexia bacterium]